MQLKAVIFDMDGVLIDSEPCWEEAGSETLQKFGVTLTKQQYLSTTGLRTKEWIDHWFTEFSIDKSFAESAGVEIVEKAIEKIRKAGKPLPGVYKIFEFFKQKKFRIGLATSSPVSLVDVVAEKLNIRNELHAVSSAEQLLHSKPHPEVYMNCAEKLGVSPLECVCFEDSFNGLISAKAARMKCVIVPVQTEHHSKKWGAADLKIKGLRDFSDALLSELEK
jgi:sugar-phosphatase